MSMKPSNKVSSSSKSIDPKQGYSCYGERSRDEEMTSWFKLTTIYQIHQPGDPLGQGTGHKHAKINIA